MLLTEAAVSGKTDVELWNDKGYYLVENGEHTWADLARSMGRKAVKLGLLKGELKEQSLGKDKAIEQAGFEAVSWGFNSRGKAERAQKLLGWQPTSPSIDDTLDEILKDEKTRIDKK